MNLPSLIALLSCFARLVCLSKALNVSSRCCCPGRCQPKSLLLVVLLVVLVVLVVVLLLLLLLLLLVLLLLLLLPLLLTCSALDPLLTGC